MLDQVNGTTPPAAEPTPQEQFAASMNLFIQARMTQLLRDGVDPGQLAVALSMFGVQFEALVSLLITLGGITREQFQLASAGSAVRMAEQMTKVAKPKIEIAHTLN